MKADKTATYGAGLLPHYIHLSTLRAGTASPRFFYCRVATWLKGVAFLLLLVSLFSCGGKGGHFRVEGRFQSFNQGEFYIYNPDGGNISIDTIRVADGRFAYEVPLDNKATFIIVFPNYSEQVVFGEPGATVKIKGDASHLREMEITGTDDNKLMTNFRLNANKMSPPEITEAAVKFVEGNLTSPVSLYLINKYLILTTSPDYAEAYRLVAAMRKADPENARLLRLSKQLEPLKSVGAGGKLPDFSATDMDGKRVTGAQLKGKVNVISAWASWSSDSRIVQRRLRALRKKYDNQIAVVSVAVDGSKKDCERWMETDSIDWPNICDSCMWNTPLLRKAGIATVPGNLVADQKGKIVARNLNVEQLEEKINSMLK